MLANFIKRIDVAFSTSFKPENRILTINLGKKKHIKTFGNDKAMVNKIAFNVFLLMISKFFSHEI